MNTRLMPWQQAAWPGFAAQLQAKRHHAWLIHGAQGTGKWELALEIARARLCRAPLSSRENFLACGECASCRALLLSAENTESTSRFSHPDFVLLMPAALREAKDIPLPLSAQKEEKKSASLDILVEDMREATDTLSLSAHYSQGRVCCVYPAEAMNTITANTLLKTLEEPPGNTLFLLVTHQRMNLLPTLRSRCLAMAAPMPAVQEAQAWLQANGVQAKAAQAALGLSGGRPMRALELAEQGDVLQAIYAAAESGRWQALKRIDVKATPISKLLPLVQRWLCDVTRVKAGGEARALVSAELQAPLQQAAKHYSWPRLRELERLLAQTTRNARHPASAPLMLDALIAELTTASTK